MGREWFSGGSSICSSTSKTKSKEANGCITGLYHIFRFHYFYFPSRHHHHRPSIDSPSRNPKGLVAPRNSLELTEESPLSTNYKEQDSLNILVGGKKSKLRAILVDSSSDICNSPCAKTPNLVARLMGLDLLPDNLDLNRSSRISARGQRLSGTRSLPESPRVSSARKSDPDIRRLSLQLNREITHEEFGCWRLKELKQDEQSQSPRNRGRQRVKQLKEKVVTRTLGMDITNLLETRKAGEAQNQIELRKVRSRFSHKGKKICSNPTFVSKQDKISQLILSKDSKENLNRVNEQPVRHINEWKKADRESNSSLHSTPTKRNRQRRAFIFTSTNSKSDGCKKTPKSCNMFKLPVASSAVSATERPRKKMKESEEPERNADVAICSGQMYKYEEKLPQESRSSNFCDSATFSIAGRTKIDFEHLQEMKKLQEEEERVVAEIERHIIDALMLEIVRV